MDSNIEVYISLSRPPKDALKQIIGGRLKGKTDINPQWRYKAMTEVFGLCGIGWYYNIADKWSKECSNGEVLVWVEVNLYIKADGEWSMPISGTGGSKIVALEKGQLVPDDEGYKKAETDALSVAMKKIGVGADIYMGRWDGSKYANTVETPETPKPAPKAEPKPAPKAEKLPSINELMDKAAGIVSEFERYTDNGYIEQYRYQNMMNSYQGCRTSEDFDTFIKNASVNIKNAREKEQKEQLIPVTVPAAEEHFNDENVPF